MYRQKEINSKTRNTLNTSEPREWVQELHSQTPDVDDDSQRASQYQGF